MKSRNPYRFAVLLALFFWIVVVLLTSQLKGTKYNYFWSLVHDRGPASFAIIFSSFYIMLMAILARRDPDRSPLLVIGLFIFALFPPLIGLLGTVQGIASILAGYVEHLQAEPTAAQMFQIKRNTFIGLAVANDLFFLGLLTTLYTYPFIFSLCWRKPKKYDEPNKASEAIGAPGAPQPQR